MESTDIGREPKVYESMWSEGNESRSRDHLQDFYFPIYIHYIFNRFTFKEQDEVRHSTH